MSADQQPAPTLGQVLGQSGGCPEVVERGGKRWKIGWPVAAAKVCLERLVAAAAFEEIRSMKEDLSAQAYSELFEGHRADIQARKYQTFGEGWDRVMGRSDGSGGELFLLSLMRTEHPEATIDDAKRLKLLYDDQLTLALDEVAPAFFQVLAEDEKVPPEARPGLVLKLKENWERAKLKRAGQGPPSS